MLYGNLPTRETNKCQSLYKQGALLQLPKGCGSEAGCHIHVLVQGKSKTCPPDSATCQVVSFARPPSRLAASASQGSRRASMPYSSASSAPPSSVCNITTLWGQAPSCKNNRGASDGCLSIVFRSFIFRLVGYDRRSASQRQPIRFPTIVDQQCAPRSNAPTLHLRILMLHCLVIIV